LSWFYYQRRVPVLYRRWKNRRGQEHLSLFQQWLRGNVQELCQPGPLRLPYTGHNGCFCAMYRHPRSAVTLPALARLGAVRKTAGAGSFQYRDAAYGKLPVPLAGRALSRPGGTTPRYLSYRPTLPYFFLSRYTGAFAQPYTEEAFR